MLTLDLKARFRNKAFLMALASALLLLLKNFGLGQYIPENVDSIVNGFITLGILLGVVTDTSTPGISDKFIQDATVQSINQANEPKKEIKTEFTTTEINNKVSENSQDAATENFDARSKIIVDNPENIQEAGKEVNAIAFTSPTAN